MTLQVRTISAVEHRAFISAQRSVALQQTPGWTRGFVTARTESVGWFEKGVLIGAGVFRYRGLPRLPMRSVAVFEQGPEIDWTGRRRQSLRLGDWTDPLIDHLRERGVFTLRVNPAVAAHDWWGVDPRYVAQGREIVPHRDPGALPDAVTCGARLDDAGFAPQPNGARTFVAEVVLTSRSSRERLDLSAGRALQPGYTVTPGAFAELPEVQHGIRDLHKGLPVPAADELAHRWQGLSSDDLAGVTLLVVRHEGRVVYGGLMAVVGLRAWDLSPALPAPDADLPVVQALRTHMMRAARDVGARTLTVPTVLSERRAPVAAPAPGWPPVHLSELIGTWQLGVRAGWHAALAPIVDRLTL